jgi:hypothetical protein
MKTIDEFKNFFHYQFNDANAPFVIELNSLRKNYYRKLFIALGFLLIGIVLIALVSVETINYDTLGDTERVVLISIFVIIVTAMIYFFVSMGKEYNKYRAIFKENVIRKIIYFISPDLNYEPTNYIPITDFKTANFFPNNHISRYRGDDNVSGKLDKTSIRFSELHAEEENKDSKGNSTWTTIFKGLFIIVDFNKNFNGKTYVLPDNNNKTFKKFFIFGEKRNTAFGELVKLESIDFEKVFAVYSTDQIEARYILSTSLMERLVNFRGKADSNIFICFANSQIYIAIPILKDLFEPRISKKEISFEQLSDYFSILSLVISIVDELNLNTRLWTKE